MHFVIQVINFGRHSANAMVPIFVSSFQAKWWCQVFALPDKRHCGCSYKYIVDFLLKSHCSVVVMKVFNYLLIHWYSLTASCCDSSENTRVVKPTLPQWGSEQFETSPIRWF